MVYALMCKKCRSLYQISKDGQLTDGICSECGNRVNVEVSGIKDIE